MVDVEPKSLDVAVRFGRRPAFPGASYRFAPARGFNIELTSVTDQSIFRGRDADRRNL